MSRIASGSKVQLAPQALMRNGFTKLDLIVAIAILFALMMLFLPAIPHSREPQHRSQCLSNLHNIGIALLAYETRNKTLPPGLPNCKAGDWHQVEGSQHADCQGPNWQTAILADIEEQRMLGDILKCLDDPAIRNVCNDCPELTESRVGTTTPPVLVCPSAEAAGSEYVFTKYGVPTNSQNLDIKLSKGSYAACFGAESYLSSHSNQNLAGAFEVVPITPPAAFANKRWMIASNKGTRLSEIIDGTSKTMLVGEILSVASEADARGVWTWPGMGGSVFTAYQQPNARKPDALPICETDADFYGNDQNSLICTQELRTTGPDTPLVHAAARSNHTSLVNVVLADGSGHSINKDIDLEVWRALSTRQGSRSEKNIGVPE